VSKSMELITGPVPGTAELLADMNLLYQGVFNIIMKLTMNGVSVELLSDTNASLNPWIRNGVQPVAVLDETFLDHWKKAVPDLWMSFSTNGLQKHLGRPEALQHWLVSKSVAVNGVGYPRAAQDYPVLITFDSNAKAKVDIQATFEIPLDFGRNWMTAVQPLFFGHALPGLCQAPRGINPHSCSGAHQSTCCSTA